MRAMRAKRANLCKLADAARAWLLTLHLLCLILRNLLDDFHVFSGRSFHKFLTKGSMADRLGKDPLPWASTFHLSQCTTSSDQGHGLGIIHALAGETFAHVRALGCVSLSPRWLLVELVRSEHLIDRTASRGPFLLSTRFCQNAAGWTCCLCLLECCTDLTCELSSQLLAEIMVDPF